MWAIIGKILRYIGVPLLNLLRKWFMEAQDAQDTVEDGARDPARRERLDERVRAHKSSHGAGAAGRAGPASSADDGEGVGPG